MVHRNALFPSLNVIYVTAVPNALPKVSAAGMTDSLSITKKAHACPEFNKGPTQFMYATNRQSFWAAPLQSCLADDCPAALKLQN